MTTLFVILFYVCSDIMLLANKLIYDDKLVCGSEEVKNGCLQLANNWTTGLVPDWLEKSINPAQSVVFLNTDTVCLKMVYKTFSGPPGGVFLCSVMTVMLNFSPTKMTLKLVSPSL